MNIIDNLFDNNDYQQVIDIIENKISKKENISTEDYIKYIASIIAQEDYEKLFQNLNNYGNKPYKRYDSPEIKIRKIKKYKNYNTLPYYMLRELYKSLILLEKYNEACYYISAYNRIFPEMSNNIDLVLIYIRCNKFKEAERIINKSKFNSNEYLKIANSFIKEARYKEGKKYLNMVNEKDLTDDEYKLLRFYLKKIDGYEKGNRFIEMRYDVFKKKHQLSPGDVVYVKKTNNYYKAMDYKSHKRPYLIWKIDKGIIYSFPVTKTILKGDKSYIIRHHKYLNFDSDRKIKDNLVLIKEEDIEKVLERIDKLDFEGIIKNIYIRLMKTNNVAHRELSNIFIEYYQEKNKLQPGNIIDIKINNKYKNYLVIENNNNILTLVEVNITNDKIVVKDYKPKKFDSKSTIYILNDRINSDQQHQIDTILNNYYHHIKSAEFGDVIKVENNNYLIVCEDEKYFLCKDVSFNVINFDFKPVIIPKNTFYEIIEHYSEDKLSEEINNAKRYKKYLKKGGN